MSQHNFSVYTSSLLRNFWLNRCFLANQFLFLKLRPLDNKSTFRRRVGRPYERQCKSDDQTVLLWTLNKVRYATSRNWNEYSSFKMGTVFRGIPLWRLVHASRSVEVHLSTKLENKRSEKNSIPWIRWWFGIQSSKSLTEGSCWGCLPKLNQTCPSPSPPMSGVRMRQCISMWYVNLSSSVAGVQLWCPKTFSKSCRFSSRCGGMPHTDCSVTVDNHISIWRWVAIKI